MARKNNNGRWGEGAEDNESYWRNQPVETPAQIQARIDYVAKRNAELAAMRARIAAGQGITDGPPAEPNWNL